MKNLNSYDEFINEGWFSDIISKFTQGWKSIWGTTGLAATKAAKKIAPY
jgi:hypothetical protein